MEKEVGRDLQKAVEKAIELYSKIKEGKMDLGRFMFALSFDISGLEFDCEEFTIRLGNHIAINYIAKLKPS